MKGICPRSNIKFGMRLWLPSFYYLCIHTEHWQVIPNHLPQSLLSNKQEFGQESTLEWPTKEERGKAWGFTDSLTHPACVYCSPRFRDGWVKNTPCPHGTSVRTGNEQENEERYYPRSGRERLTFRRRTSDTKWGRINERAFLEEGYFRWDGQKGPFCDGDIWATAHMKKAVWNSGRREFQQGEWPWEGHELKV